MTKSPSSKNYQKILSQVPRDYYDKGVKNNLFQKIWHTKKWSNLAEFLDMANGKLLDIGCADGTTTKQIKNSFPKLNVTGIDLYKNAINFAKKSPKGVTFIKADAHKLPFKNNTFDFVTAIEVLEHMHDSEKVVKEISRVLRPGGSFIVVQDTDSILFKAVWWFWTKSKGAVWENSHINCMQPDELISIIKKNGFYVRRTKYMNFKMEIFIKAIKKSAKKR